MVTSARGKCSTCPDFVVRVPRVRSLLISWCRPSSKTHIRHLCERIQQLEEEVRMLRGGPPTAPHSQSSSSPRTIASDLLPDPTPSDVADNDDQITSEATKASKADSIIARLCGAQWQLNTDERGQFHFFGPTSSLHLTEGVSSTILDGRPNTTRFERQVQDDVSLELQSYLLDVYWHYQNTVMEVVHREAFLHDMETGQTRYFSKLLLYCIFACAARISDRPHVRALAATPDDDPDKEQPYFVKRATELLEIELRRPKITTVQSLQLLSVLACAKANDTKGWLYTGNAIDPPFPTSILTV